MQTLERGWDFCWDVWTKVSDGGFLGPGVKQTLIIFSPSVTFHLVSTQLFALPQLPGRYCATPVFRHHASPNGAIGQPYMLLGTLPHLCKTAQISNIWAPIYFRFRDILELNHTSFSPNTVQIIQLRGPDLKLA